jgi:hypothetical protein
MSHQQELKLTVNSMDPKVRAQVAKVLATLKKWCREEKDAGASLKGAAWLTGEPELEDRGDILDKLGSAYARAYYLVVQSFGLTNREAWDLSLEGLDQKEKL